MRFVIYLPAFNCARTLPGVIGEIPPEAASDSSLLVIDNASDDGTSEAARQLIESSKWQGRATILRSAFNSGYAGSQKLAYRYARSVLRPDAVIMLHADGQYPAGLLPVFREALQTGADVVYGYRCRSSYGRLEETPLKVRLAMAALNRLECLATGCRHVREWHSGYVAYSQRFLEQVNFSAITSTRHIDGNMLYAASFLGAGMRPVPIYKRYKAFKGFTGPSAYLYVIHCLILMRRMPRTGHLIKARDPLWGPDPKSYEVVLSPES